MYKYYRIGKKYALRSALQRIRSLIIFAVPVAFLLIPAKLHPYLGGLFILELIVLGLDFLRVKKVAHNNKLIDWFVIIGTNLYIAGVVSLTNGFNGPLNSLLIIPTLFFTMEFGLITGVVNLIALFLFIGLNLLIRPGFSFIQVITGLTLLLIIGLNFALIAVHNRILARYHRKIMKLLIRDDLTGLFNRRYLKTKILEEIRQQNPFALIMLDINFFKYFNDQWGHSRGDSLLITFGRFLKQTLKENCTIIRVSGDEFIVFMPIDSQDQITQVVEDIQNAAADFHFPGEECFPQNKLSLSLGTVCFPEQAGSYDELLEKVDQRLYQNKKLR